MKKRTGFLGAGAILIVVLTVFNKPIRAALAIAFYEQRLTSTEMSDTTETGVTATMDPDGREATLLSAFFGLDNGLPPAANRVICDGAAAMDGMPVIFSHELDTETLQAGDLEVTTESGTTGEILCVTLAPADDKGEWRTVLVVGELGSQDDQPATVTIVGNLLSMDGSVNFLGANVEVIELEAGPTITLAAVVPEADRDFGRPATLLRWGGGSACPEGTQQVVRATWAGGVTLPGGAEADDSIRSAYKVTVASADDASRDVTPFALGDLGDGDNNHLLCLDTTDPVVAVSFPAGLMTDPREDLNPVTQQSVDR